MLLLSAVENYRASKNTPRKDSTSVQLWGQLIKLVEPHMHERAGTNLRLSRLRAPPLGDAGAQTVFGAQVGRTLRSRRTSGRLLEDGTKRLFRRVGRDGRVCSDPVAPVLKRAWGGEGGRGLPGHSGEERHLLRHLLAGRCW